MAHKFTDEQVEWFKDTNFLNKRDLCIQSWREKFGTCFTDNDIWSAWRFYHGLKKNINHCVPSYVKKPVGSERLDKDGYVRVVIEGQKERLKHHIIWEKFGNTLGRDETLLFLDGDKTNCSIENLCKMKKRCIGCFNYLKKNVINPTPKQTRLLLLASDLLMQAKHKNRERKARSKKSWTRINYAQEAIALIDAGFTNRQIAEVFGKNPDTISQMRLNYYAGHYLDK